MDKAKWQAILNERHEGKMPLDAKEQEDRRRHAFRQMIATRMLKNDPDAKLIPQRILDFTGITIED